MKSNRRIATAVLLVLTACAGHNALLRKGDRVVFLGDSITKGGAEKGGYVTIVGETLASHHPDWGIEVLGAGISGNKVPDIQRRLDNDALEKKPTLVVVYIGINDVWHWRRDNGTPKEVYEAGLRDVIQRIKATGANAVLCTPSVIGEKHDGSNQFDSMLDEYSSISRRIAGDLGCTLCDLRRAFLEHLSAHNPENQEKGILTTDGVHLNAAGNRFVAEQLLKTLGER
jgi:lysophospholipase L1-like esterase